jgi:hypothetical protein
MSSSGTSTSEQVDSQTLSSIWGVIVAKVKKGDVVLVTEHKSDYFVTDAFRFQDALHDGSEGHTYIRVTPLSNERNDGSMREGDRWYRVTEIAREARGYGPWFVIAQTATDDDARLAAAKARADANAAAADAPSDANSEGSDRVTATRREDEEDGAPAEDEAPAEDGAPATEREDEAPATRRDDATRTAGVMWPAERRVLLTLGVAPPSVPVALLCTLPDCRRCDRFKAGARADFERRFAGVEVCEFDCSDPVRRRVARAAGVSDLPAYVILDPRAPRRRVHAPTM